MSHWVLDAISITQQLYFLVTGFAEADILAMCVLPMIAYELLVVIFKPFLLKDIWLLFAKQPKTLEQTSYKHSNTNSRLQWSSSQADLFA